MTASSGVWDFFIGAIFFRLSFIENPLQPRPSSIKGFLCNNRLNMKDVDYSELRLFFGLSFLLLSVCSFLVFMSHVCTKYWFSLNTQQLIATGLQGKAYIRIKYLF